VRHLDPDGDDILSADRGLPDCLPEETLGLVEHREQIRNFILSGRIDDAIGHLNEHFPSVLSDSSIPSAGDKPSEKGTLPDPSRLDYISPTSVNPAHLILNLRIHAFIEACRSVPLVPLVPGIELAPPAEFLLFSGLVEDTQDAESKNAIKSELLSKGQELYELAMTLQKPSDRAMYLKELGNVAGLLAYTVPEDSPMAKYLSQERREALADQINSAILCMSKLYPTAKLTSKITGRSGLPVVSHLELYTRYTTTLWSFMHDIRVKPPADRPSGVQLPPGNGTKAHSSWNKGSTGADKEALEAVPAFDLHQFLESKA
jgi:hypothetical protein